VIFMRKLIAVWLLLLLSGGPELFAGTVTGSFQTPTGGLVKNGTLTFNLSR
jgi:hypothetical protein